MMEEAVILSRAKIGDYLACPRRFQLRYLEHLPWPTTRLDSKGERSRILGQQFHTVLHRHFLGIPPGSEVQSDPDLGRWWQLFQSFELHIPSGVRKPELTLTVPIGKLTLTGRFDLLVIAREAVHIFDWKTYGRARSAEELRQDLQSKIYLAMVAECGDVLGDKVLPENAVLTYWFATVPPKELSLTYGRQKHAENWAHLVSIADEVEDRMGSDMLWSLTEDRDECRRCAYQILCGRGRGNPDLDEWEDAEEPSPIEPTLP